MLLTLFDLSLPLLRLLPPEFSHELTIQALEKGIYPKQKEEDSPLLKQEFFGLTFPNPIGMAAGFDKNGTVPNQLLKMGFGFVEAGTVTPEPQPGNPKPRLFRLPEEQAVMNRMGFNNKGFDELEEEFRFMERSGVIGINIGANKTSTNPQEDYIKGLQQLNHCADYFTINISSPNTPGLRDLQSPKKLYELLSGIMATRGAMMSAGQPWRPILVKLAPDIVEADLPVIIDCLMENAVDGIIISNTTISRDGLRESALAGQAGGISGRPLFELSTQMLARVHLLTKGEIPLIGVGGIESEITALAKLEAGASLLQLYTGMIYQGPGLIHRIKDFLTDYMQDNDLTSISEITGENAELWAKDPQEAMEELL